MMKSLRCFLLVVVHFAVVVAAVAQHDHTLLMAKVEKAVDDTSKGRLLQEAALQVLDSDPVLSADYAKKALSHMEKTGDPASIAGSHSVLRKIYLTGSNTAMALYHAEKMLDFFKESGNKNMVAKASFQVGTIQFQRADYSAALKSYLESLRLYEKLEDKFQQGIVSNAIGTIYTELNDFRNAHDFLTRSQQLARDINDSIGIAILYTDLGILYSHQQKHEEAIASFRKGMQMMEVLHDTSNLINAMNNLGVTYKKAGLYRQALDSYQECYRLMQQVYPADSTGFAKMNSNIGTVYISLKDYPMAEQYLHKAMEFTRTHPNVALAGELYNAYYELHKSKGDYKKALEYQLLNRAMADSMFNLQKSTLINELQVKYDAEKKDHEISKLSQQNKIKEAEVGKQRIVKNAFIAGFIMILLLAIVMFSRFKVKQKIQQQLEQKNNDLQLALENLKAAQTQLIQSEKMASLGQLTAGIAHEIKNPLNFINNFADISGELIGEYSEAKTGPEKSALMNDLSQNLRKISEHGKRADSIVKGMLSHSRMHAAEKSPTDINRLCEEFFSLAYHSMRANFPEFNCDLKKDLSQDIPKIHVIEQDISRVLLNIVSNAFYAVKEKARKLNGEGSSYKPEVRISTGMHAREITVSIYDNGMGIPEGIREKIYNPFFTTKPTGEGTGLGLSLSFDIIKAHGGTITLESRAGEFTIFTILLPTGEI